MSESLLRAADLYAQGRLLEAARKEADACERDGYGVTASLLRDLADEKEMSIQALAELRDIRANWWKIIEEEDPDGGPLIENMLDSVIDDLGGNDG